MYLCTHYNKESDYITLRASWNPIGGECVRECCSNLFKY